MSAAAVKVEAPASERVVPKFDPARVVMQSEGHVWRNMVAYAPEGMTLEDMIKDSTAWSRVQNDRGKALRELDRVTIFAADRSYLVDCVCTGATLNGASLSKPTKVDLPPRTEGLYEGDPNYRQRFDGWGFYWEKRSDGRRMGPSTQSREASMRELTGFYPKSAGDFRG